MRLAALIQFHTDPLLVRNRARLVRAFEPDVKVYGLYGGHEHVYEILGAPLRALLRPWVEDVFCIGGRTAFWKRSHTDLAVRDWYRGIGHTFEFDAIAVFQWDLLTLAPLSELYASVPDGALGVTALAPLSAVGERWHWLRYSSWRSQLESLQRQLDREYGFREEPHASLGPGSLLPRAFLEAYAASDVPELCHDEVRLPLYGRALGFDVVDNGLYGRWFDPAEERFFNADKHPIARDVVRAELARSGGRRAFHPYVRPFPVVGAGAASGARGAALDAIEGAGSAASRLGALGRRSLGRARRFVRPTQSVPWSSG